MIYYKRDTYVQRNLDITKSSVHSKRTIFFASEIVKHKEKFVDITKTSISL